jgi:Rrf2 family nitric oxide-sensitive transcriptional repressor
MKLTTFTDYGLRVLMYLAAAPDERATIAEVAAAFGVSEHHLTKVVHRLGRGGWIRTVRGHGGGFVLAAPASAIRIGAVVRDIEGRAEPAECFRADARPCAIVADCGLRGALAEAVAAFDAALDRRTLADVVPRTAALVALRPPATRVAAGA